MKYDRRVQQFTSSGWDKLPGSRTWLEREDKKPTKAHCRACGVTVRADKGVIERHSNTGNKSNRPVDEFNTPGYISMAFPVLFPY